MKINHSMPLYPNNQSHEPNGDVDSIYNISALSLNICESVGLKVDVGPRVSETKRQGPHNSETIKWVIEAGLEQIISQRWMRVFDENPNDKEAILKRNNLKVSPTTKSHGSADDMVEWLNKVVLDLKESVLVIVPEMLIDLLHIEGSEIWLQSLDRLESALQNSIIEEDLQWRRYCHLLLVLCYCNSGSKSRLVESCNNLISSECFRTEDLIFISTQLYVLGEKSRDFELLRDAFIVTSYSNLIYPMITDKIMVVIGECILNQYDFVDNEGETMLFLEFMARRISTCNNGTSNLARTFCAIHLQNVKKKLRDSVLTTSFEFTKDIKCILDNPHKSEYFDEYMERFKFNEPKYLYLALNTIYFATHSANQFDLLSNKASKLAQINLEAQSISYRIDDFEYSILLYNCIHNYHVIYEQYFEKITVLGFNNESISSFLNCNGYYEVVKQFLLGYFSPRTNFKTKLIPDFMLTFYPHFIKVVKENLQKISQKTNPISDSELNKDFCEQYRQQLSKVHGDCFKFVTESLLEIENLWENRAERYKSLRKEQGENVCEGSLSSWLRLEAQHGGPLTAEPCEDEMYDITPPE